jgi:hypothetical protein
MYIHAHSRHHHHHHILLVVILLNSQVGFEGDRFADFPENVATKIEQCLRDKPEDHSVVDQQLVGDTHLAATPHSRMYACIQVLTHTRTSPNSVLLPFCNSSNLVNHSFADAQNVLLSAAE